MIMSCADADVDDADAHEREADSPVKPLGRVVLLGSISTRRRNVSDHGGYPGYPSQKALGLFNGSSLTSRNLG